MNELKDTAHGIRMAETGGNYNNQIMVRVDGTKQRKVGAYGMLESKIGPLVEALGIPGADWHDRAVQDQIVNEYLTRAYKELENWDLAAVAWRYGMNLARHLKANNKTTPADIEDAGYKSQGKYLRGVQTNRPVRDVPLEGKLMAPQAAEPAADTPDGRKSTPHRRRSEDIVRSALVGMRNAQRGSVRPSNPSEDVVEEPV